MAHCRRLSLLWEFGESQIHEPHQRGTFNDFNIWTTSWATKLERKQCMIIVVKETWNGSKWWLRILSRNVQIEWDHEASFQTTANNQPKLTNQHNNSLFPLSNQHGFKALFLNYSLILPLLSHRELHANPPQIHPIANSFSLPKTATFTTMVDSPSKNYSHKPTSS